MRSGRFLFCSVRPESAAVAPEAAAVRSALGVDADGFEHVRLDRERLGDRRATDYAGVVVGGSPFDVSTPEARKSPAQRALEDDLARLAEQALAAGHPLLFTCYGIGVLTRLLGGEVGTRHGEQTAAVEIRLTDAGRVDPLTAGLPEQFAALVGHKESTTRLPAGAVLLGSSARCPVQIYRVGSVVATQFHPEATTDGFIERARVYREHGYFPADELAAVSERLRASSVTEPRRMLRRFAELARVPVAA